MKIYNLFLLFGLGLIFFSCGNDPEDADTEFVLEIHENKKEFKLGEQLQAQVKGKKDSVIYYLGSQRLKKTVGAESLNYTFDKEKLGTWDLTAHIYNDGSFTERQTEISLFNATAPVTYTYEIINKFPHATDAYTQGLEFYNNELYESTGHYGSSSLRKVDLQTGEVLQKIDIPANFFAEGITILNGKLYQLTWKEDKGFIYDIASFEKTGEFSYGESEEGWGLTNDGSTIYKSDGTEKIWFLDPQTLSEEGYIQTVTDRTVATQLNELEWVEGKIYANTYQKDGVAIINPENGAIEGVINFSGLRDELGNTEDLDPLNDVLNGIAYNKQTKKLYVTGKDWDTLFEVVIKEN
ncbi:glutaminyl-peptide cyclotransferase [Salinimicrobium oceani]|uniref:Glutaminyl-peptide cyclotransferase n=1 Tax=Salinimicrobium oceani TaxID=2722702 RepID=A0ABX1CT23_9FLAO|nr:glutaminyl-peptide cyclotransferase [Salinimicrobium oceani]NJW51430.1 glutaminyl-peptide cyclotransferase [Salinimicrobium oceani]